tara:strand:- start:2168 stop:2542 length:375 start_codon:yes stop_codon:yes gene_type:complete
MTGGMTSGFFHRATKIENAIRQHMKTVHGIEFPEDWYYWDHRYCSPDDTTKHENHGHYEHENCDDCMYFVRGRKLLVLRFEELEYRGDIEPGFKKMGVYEPDGVQFYIYEEVSCEAENDAGQQQ